MDINDTVIGNTTRSTRSTHSAKLLLPFTQGIHEHALEYAVLLAKNRHATLAPCSLISVPQVARGARLESIQQSKDFQALVQSKAAKHGVAIEAREVYTSNVITSIQGMAQEMDSNSIILFVCNGDGVLLSTNEVKHILTLVPGQHHVIRLQRNASRFSLNPFKHFAQMLPGHRKEQMISGTSFS